MIYRLTVTTIIGLVAGLFGLSAGAQENVIPAPVSIVEASDAGLINNLHQREWVQMNERGQVIGRFGILNQSGEFVGRPGAVLSVSKDSSVVQEIKTGEDGKFIIEGLESGTYALVSNTDGSFAAYALHILPNKSSDRLTSELEVIASIVSKSRADEIVRAHAVPGDWGANSTGYYRSYQKDPLADNRKFSDSPAVALRADGRLVGRVSKPGWKFSEQDLTGNVAHILREGQSVAEVPVARDGHFEVANFKPGVYDLVVVGDDGIAALGFEAVLPGDKLARKLENTRFVSTQGAVPVDSVCCEMVQQPDCCGVGPIDGGVIAGGPIVGAPIGGGGFVGGGGLGGGGLGGGGGGGIGGGLGGLGGLLGIAGLAVGVAALANDDNNGINLATPVGP